MATLSSILAWEISWAGETGRLQSMGLQRAGHKCMAEQHSCPAHLVSGSVFLDADADFWNQPCPLGCFSAVPPKRDQGLGASPKTQDDIASLWLAAAHPPPPCFPPSGDAHCGDPFLLPFLPSKTQNRSRTAHSLMWPTSGPREIVWHFSHCQPLWFGAHPSAAPSVLLPQATGAFAGRVGP